MYVMITDCGECYSTTMEFINGVYANKEEWSKHNFHLKNGMVGELVKITPRAYIVRIKEGIYVPMSKKGIREISYNEYSEHLCRNECNDMNENQQNTYDKNSSTLSIADHVWKHLPDMREQFKQDIIDNIKKLSCDFEVNIFLPDLEYSCVIYAADMILEYKLNWGSTLPPYVIDEVSAQVIEIFAQLFLNQFLQDSINRCKNEIKGLVNNPKARNIIDDYYYKVNMRYSWH